MKLSLQIPPHLKCVATLPREISDDALKPATPLTGSVINVDRAWHVTPKQPKLQLIMLFGMPFNRGPINVDDSRRSIS